MHAIKALEGGLAGAGALTLIHETVRRVVPTAPRMDLLGMQAIAKIVRSYGKNPPNEKNLFYITMAGDVVSNALYYSLAGAGNKENRIWKGALLGLAAGIGAVTLPKPMGLNPAHSNRTVTTQIMTVAWYTIGGVVSALVMKALEQKETK
jgi:hypothetical protein